MMEENQTQINGREPYDAPRLRTIRLHAEEVLGTGCKTPSSAGTNPGSATNCTGTVCAAVDNS